MNLTGTPHHIAIEHAPTLCADGIERCYSSVSLVAFLKDSDGNEWRAAQCIRSGEHWEPAVDRIAEEAAERYGVEIIDLRD